MAFKYTMKHFIGLSLAFNFLLGVGFYKLVNAADINIAFSALIFILIGLTGLFLSLKGITIIFSRDYKRIDDNQASLE